jgi:hypothetical protein
VALWSLSAGGHEDRVVGLAGHRRNVGLLPRAPGRLRSCLGVRAGKDDVCDAVAETRPDLRRGRRAALVLHDVVEEGGDGLILAAAMLEHERSDGEEMRDVGDGRPLSNVWARCARSA